MYQNSNRPNQLQSEEHARCLVQFMDFFNERITYPNVSIGSIIRHPVFVALMVQSFQSEMILSKWLTIIWNWLTTTTWTEWHGLHNKTTKFRVWTTFHLEFPPLAPPYAMENRRQHNKYLKQFDEVKSVRLFLEERSDIARLCSNPFLFLDQKMSYW